MSVNHVIIRPFIRRIEMRNVKSPDSLNGQRKGLIDSTDGIRPA